MEESIMMEVDEWLYYLYKQKHGRRWFVLTGGGWGDTGKGSIESAIAEHFDVFVRVSGGANTGRTRFITTPRGEEEFIFHLVPSGLADDKECFIGDHVLMELSRFSSEMNELERKLGRRPSAPLHISRKAPVYLPYHSMLEAYIEYCLGADAVGTTKRGIAIMIAGIDLRIGPRIGDLEYPDALRKCITTFYRIFEDDFKKLVEWQKRDADAAIAAGKEPVEVFDLSQLTPDMVTERTLSDAVAITDYIEDIDSLLLERAKANVPTLIGLTQGWGLHQRGTYPFNSTTQTTAQAAAYCGGIPMEYFGPVALVEKLDPTRVGWGPFPTGMWDRREAEMFPKQHPELFSALKECDLEARQVFLKEGRRRINESDQVDQVELAKYIQVLLNELGATTRRGREPGWLDLFISACAAQSNGADVIALTRIDWLSDLKLNMKVGTGYRLDGKLCRVPDYPTPIQRLEQVQVDYQEIPVDLRGVDLYGSSELPEVFKQIFDLYRLYTGVPVGVVSTSPTKEGKIFRDFRSEAK
jgi:adenylosuccinate synthase